jgi:clan AA aspartic protease (TIGR02281 family)
MVRISGLLWRAIALGMSLGANFASAETSVMLRCKPDPPEQGNSDSEYSLVSVRGQDWRVSHITANEKTYERSEQYRLVDTSSPGTLSWTGPLINNPYVKMVGEIFIAGNNFNYIESLYDLRRGPEKLNELKNSCISLTRPVFPSNHTTPVEVKLDDIELPLGNDNGELILLVKINNAITLPFIVDSGATDVSVPEDVVHTLMRGHMIDENTDISSEKPYVMANGLITKLQTLTIKTLTIGNLNVQNVTGNIGPAEGRLLLGQSFLKRFETWSIDNNRQKLILKPLHTHTEISEGNHQRETLLQIPEPAPLQPSVKICKTSAGSCGVETVGYTGPCYCTDTVGIQSWGSTQ